MKTLVTLSFVIASFALSAQTIHCSKGDCGRFSAFISAAEVAVKKPDFNEAIVQYNAARVCCPSAAGAIDSAILKVFEHIENQRKKSDANADRAKKAEDKANEFLKKANRLIEYFGFTQNRAWAYKNGKFAVIDRDGKQWTDFVFENPDTFQANGYALARRGGFDVLVDLTGKTCQEYDYLFPTNKDGWYKAKKDKKYGFVDYRGQPLPGIDWYEELDTFSNGLAAVRKGDKYGYINSKGEVAIESRFSSASAFQGDMAWAALEYGQYGLIDKKGNFIIKPEYSEGRFIAPGFSQAQKTGRYGIIDKKGDYIVEPEYEVIFETTDSIAAVKKDGKWSYINLNKKGKLLFPPRFDEVNPFYEDLAVVMVDTFYRYINIDGTYAFPDSFILATDFSDGLAWVFVKKAEGDKWGCIGKDGTFKIKPLFDGRTGFSESVAWVWAKPNEKPRLIDTSGHFLTDEMEFDSVYMYFSENMTAVMKNGKWGFVGKDGKLAVPMEYQAVGSFSEGLAGVKIDEKWGFVDKNGKLVIPAQYQNFQTFFEGMAPVKVDGKWGFVNKEGKLVVPAQYEKVDIFSDGVFFVQLSKEKGNGLLKTNGDFLIAPGKYNNWGPLNEGFLAVEKKGKWGYLDSTGTLRIDLQFKSASTFQEGLALVRTDTSEGFINQSGKFIFERALNENSRSGEEYYSGFRDFSDGMAAIQIGNKRGFIDKDGKLLIPPKFDETNPFLNGKSVVTFGAGYEVLDKSGQPIAHLDDQIHSVSGNMARIVNWGGNNPREGFCNLNTGKVTPPTLTEVSVFVDGSAWFRNTDTYKWGLIDENGQILIQPQYDYVAGAENDVTMVFDYNSDGRLLLNRRGDTLLRNAVFNSIGMFSEGMAWAEDGERRGYIDTAGKLLIPLQYKTGYRFEDRASIYDYSNGFSGHRVYNDQGSSIYGGRSVPEVWRKSESPGDFSEGLAAAFKDGKWGYIDRTGNFQIPPQYDWATDFSEGLAWVKKDKKWKLIDKNGHFIEGVQYDYGLPFSGSCAVVIASGKFGMIDKSGKLLLPAEYDAIVNFSEGLAPVNKDGKWGYVNQKGEIVIRVQYDSASSFSGGKAIVTIGKSNEEVFVINKKGQLIVDETLKRSAPGRDSPMPDANK